MRPESTCGPTAASADWRCLVPGAGTTGMGQIYRVRRIATTRRARVWLALLVTLLGCALPARGQDASPAEARLKADVAYLADDAREGRSPGSKGIEDAADYIAAAFKSAGLKPAQDVGYFQKFAISG